LAHGLAICLPAFEKASLIETFGYVILTWAASIVTPILDGNRKAMGLQCAASNMGWAVFSFAFAVAILMEDVPFVKKIYDIV
jgi:hypothetical protein